MKKQTFTRQEVQHLLLALLMFSNANNNQGLSAICATEGETFGGISEHLLSVLDEVDVEREKDILTALSNIKLN